MNRRVLILLSFAVFSIASSAHAEESTATACDGAQAIVDRGWMAYAAKNSVSPGAQANVGARVLALNTLMAHCAVPNAAAKPSIDLTPLNAADREIFRTFSPQGPMSALAACLVSSTSTDALQFVLKSDAAAFTQYQATRRMGGVDEPALVKMLQSSKGCGSLIGSKISASELYADLNWHLRIQPNIDRIVAWHANGGVK